MLVQRAFIGFLFIMSTVFLVASFNLPMMASGGLLGAGFFPQVISGILMILTLIYLISTFRKGNASEEKSKSMDKQLIKKQALFALALIFTLLLINFLGMLVSLGLFMMMTLIVIEKMSWVKALSFTFVIMIMINVVFVNWLGLAMPAGIFN